MLRAFYWHDLQWLFMDMQSAATQAMPFLSCASSSHGALPWRRIMVERGGMF